MFRRILRDTLFATGLLALLLSIAPAAAGQDSAKNISGVAAPRDQPRQVASTPEGLRVFTPKSEAKREKGFSTGRLKWKLRNDRRPLPGIPPAPAIFHNEPGVSVSFDLYLKDRGVAQ